MSKSYDISLLVPGSLGWEIWKQNAEGAYERFDDEPIAHVGDIGKLPAGSLAMLFPVKAFQAMPFRAPSTDDDLFEDLAIMHGERLGVRPDTMGGQLSDTFVVSREDESTILLHVVVRRPGEGDLPLRTPNEFDLSARAFPVGGDAVCVWKELGRWVFAIHLEGTLIYAQATSSGTEAPDQDVVQEIRLALSQLALQGLKVQPDSLYLWPPEGQLGEAGALADAFDATPVIEHRPDPRMPDPPSRILPEDVRAARRARKQRNQIIAGVAVAGLLLLAGVGYVGYDLWQDIRQRSGLQNELAEVGGVAEAFETHRAKWDELGPVVDSSRNPLNIMLNIKKAIPANSGLRLDTVEINLEENTVGVQGEAPESAPVNAFFLALKRQPDLSWLEWADQAPQKSDKGWEFLFDAGVPDENP